MHRQIVLVQGKREGSKRAVKHAPSKIRNKINIMQKMAESAKNTCRSYIMVHIIFQKRTEQTVKKYNYFIYRKRR